MDHSVDIAIEEGARQKITHDLSRVLADTYTLYLKTQNFHWNVTGPTFRSLHLLFEEQYKELADALDEIAERIRMLGAPAPGSFAQFAQLTSIDEEKGQPEANEMVRQLVHDNETVIRVAREAIPAAEEAEDSGTADLLTDRLRAHEKAAWMLRSVLETRAT